MLNSVVICSLSEVSKKSNCQTHESSEYKNWVGSSWIIIVVFNDLPVKLVSDSTENNNKERL